MYIHKKNIQDILNHFRTKQMYYNHARISKVSINRDEVLIVKNTY